MHLPDFLPSAVELGAEQMRDSGTEIVTTDSGREVRNNRHESILRSYQVSYPMSARNQANHEAVLELYDKAEGSLHTFNFRDWTDGGDGTVRKVRFDGSISVIGMTPDHDRINGVNLKEVFE